MDARWVCWDDPAVDWAAADLVAVRSTWDYHRRCAEFLDWARTVEKETPFLNGADVFAWNADKAYLAAIADRVPVVPTELLDDRTLVTGLSAALDRFGTVVVKSRTGASGVGVVQARGHRRPPPERAHRRAVGRAAAGRVGADPWGELGVRDGRRGRLPGRQGAGR